jgi:hypothetical protein|tara:strand:+ start:314 stop:715 length:402 start_codon:yes stop_codon:yes gene_type:complete
MSILSKIFSSGATELVKGVGGVIDNLSTSDEERLEAKRKIKQAVLDYEKSMQEQVTSRWLSDNNGGLLSKNIRPIALAFLTFMFVVISVFSGNIGTFQIQEEFIPVYQTLLIVIYTAYFGGRSFEKIKNKRYD